MAATDTKPCYTCKKCGSVASYIATCCGRVMQIMGAGS